MNEMMPQPNQYNQQKSQITPNAPVDSHINGITENANETSFGGPINS